VSIAEQDRPLRLPALQSPSNKLRFLCVEIPLQGVRHRGTTGSIASTHAVRRRVQLRQYPGRRITTAKVGFVTVADELRSRYGARNRHREAPRQHRDRGITQIRSEHSKQDLKWWAWIQQGCSANLYNVTKGASDLIQEGVQGCLCVKLAQPSKVSIHVNLLKKLASKHQDYQEIYQVI